MKLTKNRYPLRCDAGGCGRIAAYCLMPERAGVRGAVYLCPDCARDAYLALKEEFEPKRTAKK